VDTLVDVAGHVSFNILRTSPFLQTSTHIMFPPKLIKQTKTKIKFRDEKAIAWNEEMKNYSYDL
jgi:hypothetical protein